MSVIFPKRALISVSDKTNLIPFARDLIQLGIEIIATGGTSRTLQKANITHLQLDDITGVPELFDGRIKSLHTKILGGILGKRDTHEADAKKYQIDWIDLVVVNFYPFSSQNKETDWDKLVELIDIGGPTLVRSAAKNFSWVGVVTNPSDYDDIISELKLHQGLTFDTRKKLAKQAFELTSQYDTVIHHYFETETSNKINFQLKKVMDLRYGENPHQKASAYQFTEEKSGILSAIKHQGKPLSFNNILDANAAWACVLEFNQPTCVIIKHTHPCGVASSHTINDAYEKAYSADSLSAFGGIIALNEPCTKKIAESIVSIFIEVIIAPSYTHDALVILSKKPAIRVLEMRDNTKQAFDIKFVSGGMLIQDNDSQLIDLEDLNIVTKIKPAQEEVDSMLFAWRVLKHIKSNGILLARDQMTVGIGAGQVSRIDAVDLAIRKAGEKIHGAILASDAFFPFRDSIDRISKTGIRAIIQPGGSIRDSEVIDVCNEHGLAMVFTGRRCFKH